MIRNIFLFFLFFNLNSFANENLCEKLFSNNTNILTQQIMSHLQSTMDTLYSTSGFKNNDEIIKAALNSSGPMAPFYRQAYEILRDEEFMIGIRVPYRHRLKIAENGFLTSYETNDSQGSLIQRSIIEASYANMTIEEWDSIPSNVKVKYAALYPLKYQNLSAPSSMDSYGTDIYFFKLSSIKNRISITAGDSYNRMKRNLSPLTTVSISPTSWDQLFIPWKDRFLLIPCLAEGLSKGKLGFGDIEKPNKYMKLSEYGQQQNIFGSSLLSPYKMSWEPNMDYFEIQIWDILTVQNDGQEMQYKNHPPKGKLGKILRNSQIHVEKQKFQK